MLRMTGIYHSLFIFIPNECTCNMFIIILMSPISPHYLSFSSKEKYNTIHSKQSNQWIVRKVYEPTTQHFRKDLVQHVILQWLEKNVRLGDQQSHIHPPHPTPKPNKDNFMAQHTSRFPGDDGASV